VRRALDEARTQLAAMRPGQLADGSWFQTILQRSARRHIDRRTRIDGGNTWRRALRWRMV